MERSDNKRKATVAALVASTLFGFSFLASRVAMENMSLMMLLSARYTLSLIFMLILVLTGIARLDLRGKKWGRLVLLSVIHPLMHSVFETNGVRLTSSSFSGIMMSLVPVATALISAAVFREKLPLKKMMWILCSAAGVAVISIAQGTEGHNQILGVLCLLVAIFTGSCFYIFSGYISDEFTSFERTFVMMVSGSTAFTLFAAVRGGDSFIPDYINALTDMRTLLPILYLSLVTSVIAFYLQNYSVSYLDPSTVTAFGNIVPVVSVIAGTVILHEPFSALYVVGIILILLGVYKVNTQ